MIGSTKESNFLYFPDKPCTFFKQMIPCLGQVSLGPDFLSLNKNRLIVPSLIVSNIFVEGSTGKSGSFSLLFNALSTSSWDRQFLLFILKARIFRIDGLVALRFALSSLAPVICMICLLLGSDQDVILELVGKSKFTHRGGMNDVALIHG